MAQTVTTAINGEVSTVTVAERLVTGSSVEEPATLSLHPLSLVSIERKIHAGTGFSYTYPTRYLDSAGTATGSYANPTGYTNGSYSSYTNGSYSGYTNGSYSGYTNGSYSGYSVKALSPVETQSGLLRISRAARFAANWKMLAMVTAGGCGWMSL